jgi:hypothetical protein
MNMKNFLAAGIAGGVTDFLLGWLLYGMLFHGYFGGGEPNMQWIVAGCMAFGLFMAYLFTGLSSRTTFAGGMVSGAVVGLFMGLIRHFFEASMAGSPMTVEQRAVDIIIGIVMGALVGGVVAMVNGKMSKPAAA